MLLRYQQVIAKSSLNSRGMNRDFHLTFNETAERITQSQHLHHRQSICQRSFVVEHAEEPRSRGAAAIF